MRDRMTERLTHWDGEKTPDGSLVSFKVFLGPIATRYTDAQLVQLRSDMHAAARLLLDFYLLKESHSDTAWRSSFDNSEI